MSLSLFPVIDSAVDYLDRPFFLHDCFTKRWRFDFPALSRFPAIENYQEAPAFDPTLKSEFTNGRIKTRQRYTHVPLRFTFKYRYLTTQDKIDLIDFQSVVGYGANFFYWLAPEYNGALDVEIRVRFDKLITFEREPTNHNLWSSSVIELVTE